ncbi:MAG: hypothetical protein HRT64_08175 [Erythrobacter sp.]|nr:hypothetical protein [Erythrobacter sp.]
MVRLTAFLALGSAVFSTAQPALAQRQPDVSDCERVGANYVCRQPDGRTAQFSERTYQRLKRTQKTRDPRLPARRGRSGASAVALTCGGDAKAALSPRSLERIDLRYNTYIGSTVMVRDCGKWKAFRYNGEVMYELAKVPQAQRDRAKTGLAAQAGLSADAIESSVVLAPFSGNGGVIAPRSSVYPYDVALEIDPQGVKAANVPAPRTSRFAQVRQVPYAIAQTPEYQAEQAKRRAEISAIAAVLALEAIASARASAGTGENCREEVQPIGLQGQARPVLFCD